MKLTKVQVTNFRSVEDSGPFEVDQTVCLVGKNEAGKSAVLQAITGLNPHPSTPFNYVLERDYPRRHLTEYSARHDGESAQVIRTEWSLSPNERGELDKEFGIGWIKDDPIVITRSYGDSQANIEPPVDWKQATQNFVAGGGLSAAEIEPLASAGNSEQLRKAIGGIASPTENQKSLLQKLDALPGKNIGGSIEGKLRALLPQFMYFSHYDRMDGEIRLDTYPSRLTSNTPPITTGERVFVDFLEYSGTSIDEILAAQTYGRPTSRD